MVLKDIVKRNARMYPHKVGTIWGEVRYNFLEFEKRVNSLANALMDLDIVQRDRVAILLRNCSPYIELYFAISQAGIIIVPLNYRNRAGELTYVINHSGANTLVFSQDYVDVVKSIRPDLPGVKNFISLGQKIDGTLDYEEIISKYSPDEAKVKISEEDVISIGYTSGTTGRPKGAMITHRNFLTEVANTHACVPLSHDDVGLNFFPFFHVGFVRSITYMAMGAVNVCADFTPQTACELIEKEKVTHAAMTPSQVNMLVNYPDASKYDLSSLRKVNCGGGHTPLATIKRFFDMVSREFEIFYVSLGMTEASGCLTGAAVRREILGGIDKKMDSFIGRRPSGVSVGRAIPYGQVRIVDEDGKDVPAWEPGEVLFYGDNVMKGYWRMPEATQETLKDGWLHSGDIALYTDEGEIYIVDRKKDMILSGDENIYPAEIEEVLYSHPAILEVAVIGVPDEKWGETVKAIVVLKKGDRATAGEIIEYCKGRLSGYKKPTSVDFLNQLPRSPSGKVLKTELRRPYWGDKKK